MSFLYNAIFYNPLLNILVVFYNSISFQSLGLAIIFLTVFIRIILFPLFEKSARYQIIMQRLQPEVKKLQDKYKDDKAKQTEVLMALYKENKTNPFSGFLFLILQLPILIALYQIFFNILKPDVFQALYSFVDAPGALNTNFLGLINLAVPNTIMVGLSAIGQYFQVKTALPKHDEHYQLSSQEKMNRNMAFIAPLVTLFIFMKLPAAISLYWLTTSLFSIIQQEIIQRKLKNGKVGDIH
jgi:YidC/Oxa1 family membrane protein insertase